MSSGNPGGQKAVTRNKYNALSPREQGYVSYMQSAWNPVIPKTCHYPEGTPEREQWETGGQQAMLAVQDMEE